MICAQTTALNALAHDSQKIYITIIRLNAPQWSPYMLSEPCCIVVRMHTKNKLHTGMLGEHSASNQPQNSALSSASSASLPPPPRDVFNSASMYSPVRARAQQPERLRALPSDVRTHHRRRTLHDRNNCNARCERAPLHSVIPGRAHPPHMR